MVGAADGELVMYGTFSLPDPTFRTQQFVAKSVYRGMPGIKPASNESFYTAADRVPPIQCLVAPCPNEIATLVNTAKTYAFDTFSVARASVPFADRGWLTERIQHHGAVVSAAVVTKYWSTAESLKNVPWCGGPRNIMFSPIWCLLGATGSVVETHRQLVFISLTLSGQPGALKQTVGRRGVRLRQCDRVLSGCPSSRQSVISRAFRFTQAAGLAST